jgi:endogenous inhibitor of DNA gyrase (YacG/DUF329 family)
MAKKTKSLRRKIYEINKGAKVGTECTCPVCGTPFVKKQYSQAFCSGACKDKFWNDRGDRHSAGYQVKYNSEHPERLHFVANAIADKMGLGYSSDDMEEREAIERYLTDPEFKKYIDDGNLDADGSWDEHQASVTLAQQLRNFDGLD